MVETKNPKCTLSTLPFRDSRITHARVTDMPAPPPIDFERLLWNYSGIVKFHKPGVRLVVLKEAQSQQLRSIYQLGCGFQLQIGTDAHAGLVPGLDEWVTEVCEKVGVPRSYCPDVAFFYTPGGGAGIEDLHIEEELDILLFQIKGTKEFSMRRPQSMTTLTSMPDGMPPLYNAKLKENDCIFFRRDVWHASNCPEPGYSLSLALHPPTLALVASRLFTGYVERSTQARCPRLPNEDTAGDVITLLRDLADSIESDCQNGFKDTLTDISFSKSKEETLKKGHQFIRDPIAGLTIENFVVRVDSREARVYNDQMTARKMTDFDIDEDTLPLIEFFQNMYDGILDSRYLPAVLEAYSTEDVEMAANLLVNAGYLKRVASPSVRDKNSGAENSDGEELELASA